MKEYFFLFSLCLCLGCQSASSSAPSDTLPPCLQNPTAEEFLFMRGVVDLHQDASKYRQSIYIEADAPT
ncbi:MAG: hypothetical protein AAFR59_07580, partial [Bacteroidota bacterium]